MQETARNNIKKFRKEKRLTQSELAQMLGVSRCFLMYVETGRRNIPVKFAKNLEKIFKVPFWEFLKD